MVKTAGREAQFFLKDHQNDLNKVTGEPPTILSILEYALSINPEAADQLVANFEAGVGITLDPDFIPYTPWPVGKDTLISA